MQYKSLLILGGIIALLSFNCHAESTTKSGLLGIAQDHKERIKKLEIKLEEYETRIEQLEKNISFMAEQPEYSGEGENVKLTYSKKTIDTHRAWNGKDTYTVPRDGTYYLTVSYKKDSYGDSKKRKGTTDDVYVRIYVNGSEKVRAWAGQTSSPGGRFDVCKSAIQTLKKKDKVWTAVSSDDHGKLFRHLRDINFALFRIGD